MTPGLESKRWRSTLPYALLAGLVLLVWGHTVGFGFVWDDQFFITDLPSIRSLQHVPEMFYSLEAQSSYPKGFVLFRPLRTVHYALLHALGGGAPQPWLFHLANVLWQAGVAMLLFRLLQLLLGGNAIGEVPARAKWFALLGAACFAVHPAVSEVVCWAKSLDDLMATAFVLAASHRLLIWQPTEPTSRRHFWWAVGYFALAVYSKESAVPFVLFAPVLFYFFKRISFRETARQLMPFAAVALIFVLHRHWVIGRTSQTAPLSGSYVQTLIDTLPAAKIYLRLLAGIPPFAIDYGFMKTGHSPASPAVICGLLLVLAVPAVAWFAFRRKAIVVGAGFLWLGIFLLPFANLIPMMQFCAERFLFLPMVGWVLVLTWLLWRLPWARLAGGIGVGLVIAWAGIAWSRSWIWHDAVTLFVQSHMKGPTTKRIQENAVGAVLSLPHVRQAFVKVHLPGEVPRVHLQAPESLAKADWPAIERTLDELHRLLPSDPTAATALAIAKVHLRKLPEAIAKFELAVREQPNDLDYLSNLGNAYVENGEAAKGEATFRRVLERDPRHVSALKSLTSLYWKQQRYEATRPLFEMLRTANPNDPSAEYWLKQIPATAPAATNGSQPDRR